MRIIHDKRVTDSRIVSEFEQSNAGTRFNERVNQKCSRKFAMNPLLHQLNSNDLSVKQLLEAANIPDRFIVQDALDLIREGIHIERLGDEAVKIL